KRLESCALTNARRCRECLGAGEPPSQRRCAVEQRLGGNDVGLSSRVAADATVIDTIPDPARATVIDALARWIATVKPCLRGARERSVAGRASNFREPHEGVDDRGNIISLDAWEVESRLDDFTEYQLGTSACAGEEVAAAPARTGVGEHGVLHVPPA